MLVENSAAAAAVTPKIPPDLTVFSRPLAAALLIEAEGNVDEKLKGVHRARRECILPMIKGPRNQKVLEKAIRAVNYFLPLCALMYLEFALSFLKKKFNCSYQHSISYYTHQSCTVTFFILGSRLFYFAVIKSSSLFSCNKIKQSGR
jgi:hypothetical protein